MLPIKGCKLFLFDDTSVPNVDRLSQPVSLLLFKKETYSNPFEKDKRKPNLKKELFLVMFCSSVVLNNQLQQQYHHSKVEQQCAKSLATRSHFKYQQS